MHPFPLFTAITLLAAMTAPGTQRESLGVFGEWGAFRDAEVPRCYAIAQAADTRARRDATPYVTVGTWPRRNVRAQLHVRLGRQLAERPRVLLSVGGRRFDLQAANGSAWSAGAAQDAAIVAAMRAASRMSVTATDNRGNRFTDRYSLDGAATAIDAAAVGCIRR